MKKICFVVAIPMTAGAFLRDHIAALSKEYEVYLVANVEDVDIVNTLSLTAYQSIPINRKISLWKDLVALWKTYRYFKKMKFDAVHSVTPKAGLICSIAGWLARVPNRIHIYTGQVWATRKGIMRAILKFMDCIPATLNTQLLVDGNSQRQFLLSEGVLKEQNSKVLAYGSISGVHLERFNISQSVRNAERQKFGFATDDVVYIFLGRLNHDKGIGEIYEAFNRLVVACPKAKLLLYGMDEEGYEKKVDDFPNIKKGVNFFYPGKTSSPYDALQGGDVFVLPTWREGFGSSVIEAQALSLPVITSDAYGVVDASVPGETGLRCKVGDAYGLYECMKQYYENPDMRILHGANGRKRVEQLFDYKIVSQAWADFYSEMLS